MYPRTKTVQGRTYLQIVESYREGGKTRQRVIATLGRLDKLQATGQIDNILARLARYADQVTVMKNLKEGKLKANRVTRIGPDLITARIWSRLGLGPIIEGLAQNSRHAFSIERAVYLATLARLFFPGSDRRSLRLLRDYRAPGTGELELHHLYRAMAWLGENRERIEEEIFAKNRTLFTSLSVVFWDTTSIYFEGRGGATLGQKGYSKDRKPDENQMIVGAVLNDEGRPIAAPMWPGNRADVATLVPVATSLKERFGCGEVTLVGDRGMVSAGNIKDLEAQRFTYILGVKMRLQKKAMREVLSRAGRFKEVAPNLKVKEVRHRGKRYIVCLNPHEAKKDSAARQAILKSLEEKLKRGARTLVGNTGYRRYLKVEKGAAHIDPARVKEEERYDGKWVLVTNTDLPAAEVAKRYKELWMVERIFREAKDTLSTRPVFHKCDATILGHVFVSFLALLVMHELKKRLDFEAEWDEIRADLDALYEVEVQNDGQTFLLRSPLQGVAGKVFRNVGVAIPPAARATNM